MERVLPASRSRAPAAVAARPPRPALPQPAPRRERTQHAVDDIQEAVKGGEHDLQAGGLGVRAQLGQQRRRHDLAKHLRGRVVVGWGRGGSEGPGRGQGKTKRPIHTIVG